ncbi:MAG: delta-60 repeat domain-containing protein [Acidimicrobiales bacterium]
MAPGSVARRRGIRAAGLAASVAVMVLSSALATTRPAMAAPGDLDPRFAIGGLAIDGASGRFEAVTTQPDGKIVVAGTGWSNDMADFQVVRYSATGALDPTFGAGGRARSDLGRNELGTAVAVQRDGKIVVGGMQTDVLGEARGQGLVARYLADGTLDSTFGTGGWSSAR